MADGSNRRQTGVPERVDVYQTPAVVEPVQQPVVTNETRNVSVQNERVTPIDRIRWGPIIAGIFAALSTLALLSLLGLAIGASNVDTGSRARDYGIGAGIWGGLSVLVAFLVGGWLAARTAAVRGEHEGLLHGAMVWAVAIPLLLYLLTSGVSSLVGTAATTSAQVAGAAAGQAANNPAVQATAQAGAAGVQATAQALTNPQNVTRVAGTTAKAAWGTLGSLLLGLGAASLGGYFGSRRRTPRQEQNAELG